MSKVILASTFSPRGALSIHLHMSHVMARGFSHIHAGLKGFYLVLNEGQTFSECIVLYLGGCKQWNLKGLSL
jgi:hypothetical protein